MTPREQLFAKRTLEPLGIDTPLLIPSFSSRGFPDVRLLFERMRSAVNRVALVSAFDLHHGCLPAEALRVAPVVLVDSGGYESKPTQDLNEPYLDERPRRSWELNDHRRVVAALPADGLFGVISFDNPASISSQIDAARSELGDLPHATIFLCKPPGVNRWIPVGELIDAMPALVAFSALGVTEKELGPSPLERCRAIVRLRRGISAVPANLPIHVLGCLTPLSILSYFLCGADMFDGLAWLRYAFVGGLAVYGAEAAIVSGQGGLSDGERCVTHATANLRFLLRLGQAMRRYAEHPDMGVFDSLPELVHHMPSVLRLVAESGVGSTR